MPHALKAVDVSVYVTVNDLGAYLELFTKYRTVTTAFLFSVVEIQLCIDGIQLLQGCNCFHKTSALQSERSIASVG